MKTMIFTDGLKNVHHVNINMIVDIIDIYGGCTEVRLVNGEIINLTTQRAKDVLIAIKNISMND